MSKALGMIEFKTVSAGVTAADAMVKTASVELVEAPALSGLAGAGPFSRGLFADAQCAPGLVGL